LDKFLRASGVFGEGKRAEFMKGLGID